MSDVPIVIGLTTVRARLAGLSGVLRALLGQTRPPSEIRLHVSQEPFAFDDGVSEADLPDDVRRWRDAGRVRVVWTPNLGPYRKIIPMLREFRDTDAILVTVDDDVLYPPDWLAALLDSAARHPDAVVAGRAREARARRGRLARYQSWPVAGRLSPLQSSLFLPTGNAGVLYRPAFFDDRVLDAAAFHRLCPLSDDVWLRAATLARGVRVARAFPAAPEFPEVAHEGARLWNAALASDATDIALSRALAHFGLSARAFAPGPAERRRLALPLARTAGDPRAGGRRPLHLAIAWLAAMRARLARRDPAVIAFSVVPGPTADAGACVASIRRHYPGARVRIETAPPVGSGGRCVAEMFRWFLEDPRAEILVRLSTAARLWRRFHSFPQADCFGTPGARGFRRNAAALAVKSGIAGDPAYGNPSEWAPDPETRAWAETRERFLNEPDVALILTDMMRRVGAGPAPWPEVRTGDIWPRGNFLRAWAVTRPTAQV